MTTKGFNNEQRDAISLALDDSIEKLFITGTGGSGKSHVIREIVSHFKREDLVLLAPTHSAARLIGGQTIHGFFKIGMTLNMEAEKEADASYFNLDNAKFDRADGKVVIIDEVSMLGKRMLEKIIANMPVRKLILVGDPMQLSPVKDEEVDWADFCDETVELIENYRTSNPDVLDVINHFRETGELRDMDEYDIFGDYTIVNKFKHLTLRSDTVCIAHKNKTLSEMQLKLLGYTGAREGDEVMTFGTCSEHFVEIKDPFTQETKLSPYYVNGDIMKVTSGPINYYGAELYSVTAVNVEYMNKEPRNKNPKFPKPVELLIGDYDAYQSLLSQLFETAKAFARKMTKKYGDGMNVPAKSLLHKFSEDDKREWGMVWFDYLDFKSKSYARHKQFVTSYKIQGRSANDVIIHWDDLPSDDHKFVALSRAIESIQILKKN